jgi:hypothetical protein
MSDETHIEIEKIILQPLIVSPNSPSQGKRLDGMPQIPVHRDSYSAIAAAIA